MVLLTFGLLLLKNMVPQVKGASEEVTLQHVLRLQVTEHQDSVHHPDQFPNNMVPQLPDHLYPKVMVPQASENLPLVLEARLMVLLGIVFHSLMVHRLHVPSPLLMELPVQEVRTRILKDLNLDLLRTVPQVQEVFLTRMALQTQEVFLTRTELRMQEDSLTSMGLRTLEDFRTPMGLQMQEVCLTRTELRMQGGFLTLMALQTPEVFLTRTEHRTLEVYLRSMVHRQAELQD